jgi:membrane protease YdiL (CAAX protease family)
MTAPHSGAPADAPLPVAVLQRRWATLAGIAAVSILWAAGVLEDIAEGLVVAAVIYWVWGAARGQRAWLWRRHAACAVPGATA